MSPKELYIDITKIEIIHVRIVGESYNKKFLFW